MNLWTATLWTAALTATNAALAGSAPPPSSSGAPPEVSVIRSLPPGAGWNVEVRKLLLARADADKSGSLDKPAEIDAIGCQVWAAVDEGVRRDWRGSTVVAVYGFVEGAFWSGGELGVSDATRAHALGALASCGIHPVDHAGVVGGVVGGTLGVPSGGARPPQTSGPPTGRDISAQIAAVPTADTSAWGTSVGRLFTEAYDIDGSGGINQLIELATVPCPVWKAMDAGTRAGWSGTGLRVIYGFDPGYGWVGSRFGIDEHLRSAAMIGAATCGVGDPIADVPAAIRGLPEGGHEAWDALTARALLQAYDLDRSGQIDAVNELDAMPCPTWAALDQGVRAGWGTGIRQVYGLMPELVWVGDTLAISERVRPNADEAAARCDLDGLRVAANDFSTAGIIEGLDRIRPIADMDPPTLELLVGAYDTDRSGAIDHAKEIKQIPCAVWGGLNAMVQEDWDGTGARVIYGFKKGYIWVGYALGFDEGVRAKADAAMKKCGL
jgi:hypothetical protein